MGLPLTFFPSFGSPSPPGEPGLGKQLLQDLREEVEHIPGHKKKIFCSDGCRRDWWNRYAQFKTGGNRATRTVVCVGCGKKFVAYRKKRKYCGRECYVKTMKDQLHNGG